MRRLLAARDLDFEDELRRSADAVSIRDGYLLFWDGWPSQWFPSAFEVDGSTYNCAEQFMMAEKARLFGDEEALERIMWSPYPKAQKEAGRLVRGFDEEQWAAAARDVVFRGNLAKFSQDAAMRKRILGTSQLRIVEASPEDRLWGIGLDESHEDATKPERWRGTNWLGEALEQVRAALERGHLGS